MLFRRYLIGFFIAFGSLLLSFSNPGESQYLSKITDHYLNRYHDFEISSQALKSIGNHERVTYVLFSTYTYRIGRIQIYYFGIANTIFYLGSQRNAKKMDDVKIAYLNLTS